MPDPQRDAPPVPKKLIRADSIIIVNTGNGKGKSSSAFGVMARAWAREWRVVVVQFVKSGKWQVGEKKLAEHLGIEWHTMGDGFTWESTDLDETVAKGRQAWDVAKEKLSSGEYDLVILDEFTYAMAYNWIEISDVVAALSTRASTTNVIITGRHAPAEIIELADTVTEMTMVKHAYEKGIRAKKGIEY